MDPVSIISLAATALSIVDRLGKMTSFFLKLSTQMKFADIKCTMLIGYLTSLNAAIQEIANISKGLSNDERYRRLAESLSTTLDCTILSLSFLESMANEMQVDSSDSLGKMDRIMLVLKGDKFDEYISGVSTYVNALNLLLNALQSRTLLEQQGILDSPDAKSIMTAMKDETSSLFCLPDDRSMSSRQSTFTDHSAALGLSFTFDEELLGSSVYAAAYRSHLRELVSNKKSRPLHHTATSIKVAITRAKHSPINRGNSVDAAPRVSEDTFDTILSSMSNYQGKDLPSPTSQPSEESSRSVPSENTRLTFSTTVAKRLRIPKPQGESKQRRKPPRASETSCEGTNLKCLVLGASESGKITLVKTINLLERGTYTAEERVYFKDMIIRHVVDSVLAVFKGIKSLRLLDSHAVVGDIIKTFEDDVGYVDLEWVRPQVFETIDLLKRDREFQAALDRRSEFQIEDNVSFYLDSIDRILAPNYSPSDEDILYFRVKTTGIYKSTVPSQIRDKRIILNIFDVGGKRSERKKWNFRVENAHTIFFVVDVAAYDQPLREDTTTNFMEDQLALFDSVCNWSVFADTNIILCFMKVSKLQAKLRSSPLKDYYADFEGGDDYEKALGYFQDRFLALNKVENKTVSTHYFFSFPTESDWVAVKNDILD